MVKNLIRTPKFVRNWMLGRNSQKFLRKILKIFVTFSCFYKILSWSRTLPYDSYNIHFQRLLISTLRNDLTENNQDILRLKVTKILRIWL